MNLLVLLMGIIYPAIGVLTWIVMGAYWVARYKIDKANKRYRSRVWSEDRQCAVWAGTIFAGPLWPLALVVGLIWFIGHSVASRELASTETAK